MSIAILVALAPLASHAKRKRPRGKKRIAVLPLKKRSDYGKKSRLTRTDLLLFTETIQEEAARLPKARFTVMTKENILEMLPPGTTVEDCTSKGRCQVEQGRMLGAHFVVTGDIYELRNPKTKRRKYRVKVKVHRTVDNEILGTTTFKTKNVERIENGIAKRAKLLFTKIGWRGTRSKMRSDYKANPDKKVLVYFKSKPKGASVTVDGENICNGKESVCKTEVTVGPHNIEMNRKDYYKWEKTVDIRKTKRGKNPTVTATLDPAFALIYIDFQPRYYFRNNRRHPVKVTQNGKEITLKTKWRNTKKSVQKKIRKLDRPITIALESPCHQSVSQTVELRPGDRKQVTLKSKPLMAGLTVSATDKRDEPIEANVRIDGRKQQKTTTATYTIPACSYQLKVSSDRHGTATRLLNLTPEKDTALKIQILDRKFRRQIESDKFMRKFWGWTSVAGATGFLALGGTYLLYTVPEYVQRRDQALVNFDNPDLATARTYDDQRGLYQALGWSAVGAGALLTGIGVYLLLTKPDWPDVSFHPAVGPKSAGILATF